MPSTSTPPHAPPPSTGVSSAELSPPAPSDTALPAAELFPAQDWEPLPRPSTLETPQRIRRAEPGRGAPTSGGSGRGGSGPGGSGPGGSDLDGSDRDDRLSATTEDPDLVEVRFRHHAPQARAVALQASGWWRVEPADACDLVAMGDGWWEGRFLVPADWRATYGFLEHDGEDAPPWWEAGLKSSGARIVADATNPRGHAAGRGGGTRSVIALPDDGPFGGAAGPAGGVGAGDLVGPPRSGGAAGPTDQDVERAIDGTAGSCAAASDVLDLTDLPAPEDGGDDPRVRWWAASGGDPQAPLPLLIVLDGAEHVERLGTPALLARAVATGALPPLAAVFVDSGPRRGEVLGVPSGHARWIAMRLLPHLRAHSPLPLDTDPARTIITGSSFGGLSALFAITQAPDLIGAAIAQSVSLWRYPDGALADPLIRALGATSARLRLHAGRFEGTMAPQADALVKALQKAEVDARLEVVPGGHDWAWWQPMALRELAELLRQDRSAAVRGA